MSEGADGGVKQKKTNPGIKEQREEQNAHDLHVQTNFLLKYQTH
jgi:hypothetical protein